MAEHDNKADLEKSFLAIFAAGEVPSERRDALTALISSKFLPKNAETEEIQIGLQRLSVEAVSAQNPAHQLLAIAESIRLTQVVKRWLPNVTNILRPAFERELPPLRTLSEADDRLNVARACNLMSNEWLVGYLAQSIADEEQGEKTRLELMNSLLSRVSSLAEAIDVLAVPFGKLKPQTEDPSASIARRLTRTLFAFRVVLVEMDIEAGPELGKALLRLISDAFVDLGRPQDEKAQTELSKEVLLTVYDVVRTRISIVTEPGIYAAVSYCRQLCGGIWPDELDKPLSKLSGNVCEALVLLGRQGMRDQVLLDQLGVLTRYPERAKAIARELAQRHNELSEEVRDWLELGRVKFESAASSSAQEYVASNADAAIGLALQAARQAEHSTAGLRERLFSCLEVFEPALLSITKDSFERVRALTLQVEQAAGLRSLQLLGNPGQEVEASPKYYEVIGGTPRQKMIVRQPAVIKIKSDGQPGDVVLRGLVE